MESNKSPDLVWETRDYLELTVGKYMDEVTCLCYNQLIAIHVMGMDNEDRLVIGIPTEIFTEGMLDRASAGVKHNKFYILKFTPPKGSKLAVKSWVHSVIKAIVRNAYVEVATSAKCMSHGPSNDSKTEIIAFAKLLNKNVSEGSRIAHTLKADSLSGEAIELLESITFRCKVRLNATKDKAVKTTLVVSIIESLLDIESTEFTYEQEDGMFHIHIDLTDVSMDNVKTVTTSNVSMVLDSIFPPKGNIGLLN